MAFYTVRVDEAGNEVDRPKTSRGFEHHRFENYFNTSARYETSTSGSSVRYNINRAAYIAKSQDLDGCTSDDSLSEIVPPLDLNASGDTLPSETIPYGNYAIPKACEISRITKSDAFSNWLSGKKKLKSYELAKKKEIIEEQQRLTEEKKQLAEQKYKEWLVKKMQSKEREKSLPEREMQEYQVYQSHHDDSEGNRRAWELNKREELRRRKEELLRANERKRMLEENRKRMSKKAWENWIAEAPLKPKPVPLNQGFLTLKGTISDIFINPNPWRGTDVVDESV